VTAGWPGWRFARRRPGLAAAIIVLVVSAAAIAGRAVVRRASTPTVPVLAILPFRNVGESADQYFTDGLTEEVASRLAGLSGLIVRRGRPGVGSGSDDRQPAQIGRDYHAAYVLTGTVRWSPDSSGGRGGSRVRVIPRLIRVSDERELIGETMDAALVDIFTVQSSIAARVSNVLGVALGGKDSARIVTRPTVSIQAWDHYTRGNYHLARRTPNSVLQAITEYDAALTIDSGFTRALTRRAYAHILFVDWGWPFPGLTTTDLYKRAVDLTTQALSRDSSSADAWGTKAYLHAIVDPYRLDGSLAAFKRSLALDSMNAEIWHQYGQSLMALGHDDEAIRAYNRALSLEPERPMTLVPLSAMARIHGRLAEARRLADSAISLHGVSAPYARAVHGVYLLAQGDAAGARRDAEVALATDSSYSAPARSILVGALARLGDTTTALRELDRLRANVNAHVPSMTDARFFGAALVAMGRRDELIDFLQRVRPQGAWLWFYLKSPDFDPVRSDSRFQQIFASVDPNKH
jgi:TolB-like protein/tetratricopeptide (TPR) repeat protein